MYRQMLLYFTLISHFTIAQFLFPTFYVSLLFLSLSAFLPHPAHIVFAIRVFHSQKPHQLKQTNKKRQSTQLLNVVVIIVVSFYDKAIIMTLFCTSKLQNKLSKSMALPKYTICKQRFFLFLAFQNRKI